MIMSEAPDAINAGRELHAAVESIVSEQRAAAAAEVVAGVRTWCAINEIAEPPLDWEGLGEFLTRPTPPAGGDR